MTIIQTDEGIKIKLSEITPLHWSDYHQRFYAGGYRWIKSKQKFSSQPLLHNFKAYEIIEE